MSTPPGWYQDPSAPSTERWWDGIGWSAHTRQPGPVQPQPQQGFGPPLPEQPVQQGFGPPQAGPGHDDGGAGRARNLVFGVVAAVLVASVVTGVVLLGGGDEPEAGGPATPSTTSAAPGGGATEQSASPSASASQPAGDPAVLVDELNGITLPVPTGWVKPENTVLDEVTMTTEESYDCPSGSGFCYHGRVTSRTVTGDDERSPKAVAEKDISEAADSTYDRDVVDRRPYDGITSHERVEAGQVAVAGRSGYYVRWKVKTGAGPGGYVQSLAFPSATGSQAMVVVRFAYDAGPEGPELSGIEDIVKGIRTIGDEGDGGVGSSVGPTD